MTLLPTENAILRLKWAKQPKCEAESSPLFIDKVKDWRYISTSPYAFKAL